MWFVASDGFTEILLIGRVSLGCPTLHCCFCTAGFGGPERDHERNVQEYRERENPLSFDL